MTGREIACLIKRSRIKWVNGALKDDYSERYCAIGILGRIGGLPPEAFDAGVVDEGKLDMIAAANDKADTKAGAVKNICEQVGDRTFPVMKWLDEMLADWRHYKQERT